MALAQGSTQLDRLTPRELEVACLVASGMPHKHVAVALDISTKTVGVHVYAAASKLPGSAPPTRKLILLNHLFAASDAA